MLRVGEECEPGAVWWIHEYFSDCIYTTRDAASFALGMGAILIWTIAQLPQVLANIRNGSAEGLSIWFLLQWLFGDSLNLAGCLLQGSQLATTTWLAVYFVSSDFVLLWQYYYYEVLLQRQPGEAEQEDGLLSKDDPRPPPLDAAPDVPTLGAGPYVTALDHEDGEHVNPVVLLMAPPSKKTRASLHPDATAVLAEAPLHGRGQDAGAATGTASPAEQQQRAGGSGCGGTAALAAAGAAASVLTIAAWGAVAGWQQQQRAAAGGVVGLNPGHGFAPLTASAFAALLPGCSGGSDSNSSSGGRREAGDADVEPWWCDPAALKSLAGTIMGYAMTLFYLGSRVPQIYLNWARKSSEGLCLSMFLLAGTANICTASSILLRSYTWAALVAQLPWLVGALGTVGLDAFILYQGWLYQGLAPTVAGHDDELLDGDEEHGCAAERLNHRRGPGAAPELTAPLLPSPDFRTVAGKSMSRMVAEALLAGPAGMAAARATPPSSPGAGGGGPHYGMQTAVSGGSAALQSQRSNASSSAAFLACMSSGMSFAGREQQQASPPPALAASRSFASGRFSPRFPVPLPTSLSRRSSIDPRGLPSPSKEGGGGSTYGNDGSWRSARGGSGSSTTPHSPRRAWHEPEGTGHDSAPHSPRNTGGSGDSPSGPRSAATTPARPPTRLGRAPQGPSLSLAADLDFNMDEEGEGGEEHAQEQRRQQQQREQGGGQTQELQRPTHSLRSPPQRSLFGASRPSSAAHPRGRVEATGTVNPQTEAGLDAVLSRFSKRRGQQPRQAPQQQQQQQQQRPLRAGVQPQPQQPHAAHAAAGAAAAAAPPMQRKPPRQQQRQQQQPQPSDSLVSASARTASSRSAASTSIQAQAHVALSSTAPASSPRAAASLASNASDVDASSTMHPLSGLDLERLWREVDAAVQQDTKGRRSDKEEEHEDRAAMRASTSAAWLASASKAGPATAAAASTRTATAGFKGFGPSPAEVAAAKAEAAATAAGGVSGGKGRGGPAAPLRVFLYATEEAAAKQAVADAGLQGQVVFETNVKQCSAVIAAKQGRQGKAVQTTQGERMAANAGVPFLCVGRKMTGPNLRAALLPLLSPGSGGGAKQAQQAQQAQQQQPTVTRAVAAAAVRAARARGGGFSLPAAAAAASSSAQGQGQAEGLNGSVAAGQATVPVASTSASAAAAAVSVTGAATPSVSAAVAASVMAADEEEADGDLELLRDLDDGEEEVDDDEDEEDEEEGRGVRGKEVAEASPRGGAPAARRRVTFATRRRVVAVRRTAPAVAGPVGKAAR